MGVFQASTTEVPIDVSDPMPFSTAQGISNAERTASFARIASHPGGSLASGEENGDLARLRAQLETMLEPEISRREIAVRSEPDGLIVSLREAGFFESGSSKMKTASQPAFDRIAGVLRAGEYRLRIEGHTDNVPIHNAQFPSNWELSTARSTEIVRVLIVRDGFRPERLSAAGYAEYHPLTENRTAEGRGANRRVDIIILGKAAQPLPEKATGEGPTAAAPKSMPAQVLPPAADHPALLKPSALQPQVPGDVEKRKPR
jgi:chemotaxis protein MotB